MAHTTGRCTNDLYCANASAKQDLEIAIGGRFVCPECAKPLVTPPIPQRGLTTTGTALIAGGGILLASGGLFAAVALIGWIARAPVAAHADKIAAMEGAPSSTSLQAQQDVTASPTIDALVQAASASLPGPNPQPGAGRVQYALLAQSPVLTATPLAPEDAAPSRQILPALHLVMLQKPASQARAAEQARRSTQAALLDAQQQQATALQAQELRRKIELQQEQAAADAQARQRDEAAGKGRAAEQHQAGQVQKLAAAPTPSRGTTRGFSASPLSGGAPAYPQAYESEGRKGRVTVSCRIGQSGEPSLCHVVAAQGGVGFSNAALGWLRSGTVRFAPVLRDGAPQDGEHSWTMNFEP